MTTAWNRSLAGQLIAFMLLALLIGQVTALVISSFQRQAALRQVVAVDFVSRSSSLTNVVVDLPESMRGNLLRSASTPYARYWISQDASQDERTWLDDAAEVLSASQEDVTNFDFATLPAPPADAARPDLGEGTSWQSAIDADWAGPNNVQFLIAAEGDAVGFRVPLRDESWINGISYKPVGLDVWNMQALLSVGITAAMLLVSSLLVATRIAKPMRELANSAEALGRGETVELSQHAGPQDVQNLYQAFDQMQQRLRRFVDDRTRMLAAIGHDLRTPLTSLRLRAEFVSDPDLRQKMVGTIDEMQVMTEAALSFAKSGDTNEPTRTIDLNALLGSLCDDLVELGNVVRYEEGEKLNYRCRPDGLRRAVRNLIENAVRYAGKASVCMKLEGHSVVIVVSDSGPGIPADKLEKVFTPFFRLEQSRNRDTGGVGLGLSIARTVARQHGGDITLLDNNPGLTARMVLPLSQ